MMKYISISECFNDNYKGQTVNIRGWIHRLRRGKENMFLTLRDSTGLIQCVYPIKSEYENITRESSVTLKGKLKKDDRSPGGFEIEGDSIETVGPSDNYPISKDFSVEFLNNVRHLWNRSTKMQNIFKVRSQILSSAREWFDQNGWYETSPPMLNRSACEGGSTLFETKYFDEPDPAYLSQSAQLYLESLIFSLEKVWSLTPSFRAEKSKTPRHLAEFWHLEGEKAWADFGEIMHDEENLITYIVNSVADKKYKELEALKVNPRSLEKIHTPFERISYSEAINILNNKGFDLKFGDDLGTVEERELTLDRDNPILVFNYPTISKPFYTKINPEDNNTVLSADILAPKGFGEIMTGGQREDNLQSLIERISKDGLKVNDYSWYLDLRRYGSVPHSGFGFGIERIIKWVCNLEHIRDTIPYPRTMIRSYP